MPHKNNYNRPSNWHPGAAPVDLKKNSTPSASKLPKPKAYLIIHDGVNVLVGKGGLSGKYKSERRGYHLPGGTINSGENAETAALRELKEETGIDPEEDLLPGIESRIEYAQLPHVTFLVARAATEVGDLVISFVRPSVRKDKDEPFRELFKVPSQGAWEDDHFHANFGTDWFKTGLFAAKDLITTQVNTPS